MVLTPRRLLPDDPALADVLSLIQTSFADMDGRIDPPSSVHRLTPDAVSEQAARGEVWAIGTPPLASVFLTPKKNSLYLGKLAVTPKAQRTGLARRLIDLAIIRAADLQLASIELQTRVELTHNHSVFEALGFRETGRTAHRGYDRATSITYRFDL